jgi:hypothetical protein
MLFQIRRSSWLRAPSETVKPLDDPRVRWSDEHKAWVIDIATLDDLIDLEQPLIIQAYKTEPHDLEIYDTARE